MTTVRHFMLKGTESFIDHVKSINILGCCYWKKAKNKKFHIGDICYLYLSGKGHNAIRYKLEVVETNCERKDNICWLVPFEVDKDCYKMSLVSERLKGDDLSKDKLEEIGISRYVQFMKLNKEQVEYIDKQFQ